MTSLVHNACCPGTLARVLLSVWCVLVGACASLPQEVERPVSAALSEPTRTVLGRAVSAAQPNPKLSGFRMIADAGEALEVRRLLAQRAQRTLDLKYYIVRDDAPTRALLAEVRAAADRGVRVRVLVDDMQTEGLDAAFAAFSRHRNIELRLFNPFPGGRSSAITRLLSSAGDLARLNRRMHGKAFITDNAAGITGGRNLGAEYFLQSERMNFADLDVLAVGPVVQAMSANFDRFWNSPSAYPIDAFVQAAREAPPAPQPSDDAPTTESPANAPMPTAPGQSTSASTSAQGSAAAVPPASAVPPARTATVSGLLGRFGNLVWAAAYLLADAPTKIEFGTDSGEEPLLADNLAALMRSARREVLIVSPYFVPGQWGLDLMRDVRARGVRVRVLTNSLAATDVPIVHAGYARYRVQLLQLGVDLFELRPLPARPRGWIGLFGSSRASLHAKAVVIDGRVAFVGTLNLDPRSIRLNTEMGIVIDSTVLSTQLVALFEQSVSPENSFKPRLAADGSTIEWTAATPDGERRYSTEPDADAWRMLTFRVLGPLAPDELL